MTDIIAFRHDERKKVMDMKHTACVKELFLIFGLNYPERFEQIVFFGLSASNERKIYEQGQGEERKRDYRGCFPISRDQKLSQ